MPGRLKPLKDVMRAEFGPRKFWRKLGGLWYRARSAGRPYLSWEEWERVRELAEQYGLFAYYKGGRDDVGRAGEEIHPNDFVYAAGGLMVFLAVRRARSAKARGLSPWQFALEEDRRIDGIRAAALAVHETEIARAQATRKAAEEARRGGSRRKRSRDDRDEITLEL